MKAAKYYKDRRSHGRDLEPEDLAKILGEFVNGKSRLGKRVAEEVTCEHRTLQRNIFCLILDIIEELAETPENRQDARNERSVQMAKDICEERGYYRGSRPPLV
jgi:hypothetical protein